MRLVTLTRAPWAAPASLCWFQTTTVWPRAQVTPVSAPVVPGATVTDRAALPGTSTVITCWQRLTSWSRTVAVIRPAQGQSTVKSTSGAGGQSTTGSARRSPSR